MQPRPQPMQYHPPVRHPLKLATDQHPDCPSTTQHRPGTNAGSPPRFFYSQPAAHHRRQHHNHLTQANDRAMATDIATPQNAEILERLDRHYEAGFVTQIESDSLPPGLNETIIRALSAKKHEPEWMTEWRLAAYRHWLNMPMPEWAKLHIAPIDFQALSYYSAPKVRSTPPLTKSPKNYWIPTTNSAYHCTNVPDWPASQWMRYLTPYHSVPPSAKN